MSSANKLSSNSIQRLAHDRPRPVKNSQALAVHLIGNFLVQSFRAAGDPSLQNCCAAAIQHGLQFIHESISATAARRLTEQAVIFSEVTIFKSASAAQKGELPFPVASQFSATVVEVVHPFWTTNLQLPARRSRLRHRSSILINCSRRGCVLGQHMMQQAMGPHRSVSDLLACNSACLCW